MALCNLPSTNIELLALLEHAKDHVMTPEERSAQRKSWVIGELMLSNLAMTREEAEAIYQRATVEYWGG
jgi:hypothetical protein